MQWDQLARLGFSAAINKQDDKQHCKLPSYCENGKIYTHELYRIWACKCMKASFLKKKKKKTLQTDNS